MEVSTSGREVDGLGGGRQEGRLVEGKRVGWRVMYEFPEKKLGSRMAGQKKKKSERKKKDEEKKTTDQLN